LQARRARELTFTTLSAPVQDTGCFGCELHNRICYDMANVVQVAWARYLRQLEREPLKTKVSLADFTLRHGTLVHIASSLRSIQAITSGSLAALSDITAQKLVSNAPLNWRRTLAMALFGLIWSGPSNHYWQKFTNQLFKGKKDAASVAQKVCSGSRQNLNHLHACSSPGSAYAQA